MVKTNGGNSRKLQLRSAKHHLANRSQIQIRKSDGMEEKRGDVAVLATSEDSHSLRNGMAVWTGQLDQYWQDVL